MATQPSAPAAVMCNVKLEHIDEVYDALKMDIQEILEIFEIPNEMDNSSCSESDVCTSDEDVEDIYTSLYGCNFDDETAVDCMADLERINYKEIGSDEIMRYHFPDRLVAYKFYNLYGCVWGFAGRKSRAVKIVCCLPFVCLCVKLKVYIQFDIIMLLERVLLAVDCFI
ncbi:hypothetical protein MTR_2g069720 [Medicago truncatula]|uniref:Uncharacterized protein n=1 Tax=Medicago truncatula TaxID=3880 RepID=A0A072VJT2_MEDTR|nr:hypothetical protein MTR_2g069720 [Medicago truncatula]